VHCQVVISGFFKHGFLHMRLLLLPFALCLLIFFCGSAALRLFMNT
jgi:hypothetical protein